MRNSTKTVRSSTEDRRPWKKETEEKQEDSSLKTEDPNYKKERKNTKITLRSYLYTCTKNVAYFNSYWSVSRCTLLNPLPTFEYSLCIDAATTIINLMTLTAQCWNSYTLLDTYCVLNCY